MTPTETAVQTRTKAVAVVGASSGFGARMLLHLEAERPDYWLVAIADRPMRWPVERVSSYRLAQNRVGGTFTLADIPDVMQSKAWDLFSERRELTMAEMPDVLQLENVDSIVHVGSHYDGPDAEAFIERTSRWVDAARIAGVRQFVHLSDIRTYGIGKNNPIPVTERSGANPAAQHRYLVTAEPALPPPDGPPIPPMPGVEDPNAMRVAILRTAMSVGPGSSSPVVDELFYPAMNAGRKHEFPIQLVHQHDLARAVEATISRQLNGIFNIVGDGVVSSKEMLGMCEDSVAARSGRAGRLRRSVGAELAKYPLIVSANKFKQQAKFKFKYSSVRAARVFCHTVLLEPG